MASSLYLLLVNARHAEQTQCRPAASYAEDDVQGDELILLANRHRLFRAELRQG
jgi:hypothetical protein